MSTELLSGLAGIGVFIIGCIWLVVTVDNDIDEYDYWWL